MDKNDIDLSGKVAVITGGGGGIGRAIALCMADMGADIAIIESIPERCEQMRELVGQRGRQVLALECNVMEADKLREAMQAIKERFGRIDILVNNAGGVAPRAFVDLKESSFRRHIELNLVSTVIATQIAATEMRQRDERFQDEGTRSQGRCAVRQATKPGSNSRWRRQAWH